MTRRSTARLAQWIVVLAVLGCGKILGVKEGSPAAPATDASTGKSPTADAASDADAPTPTYLSSCGGLVYGSQSCRDCVDTSCCKAVTTCGADPACVAIVQCEERCAAGDEVCRSRCAYISHFASTELDDLTYCEATVCPDCRSGRSFSPRTGTSGDAMCNLCEVENCPEVLDAFSKDREALALRRCGGFGGTCYPQKEVACIAECQAQHSAGKPNLDALVACDTGVCNAACTPTAPDWGCLGSVVWPPPTPSTKQIDLVSLLVRYEDITAPLVGFQAKACLEADVDCTAPRATTTSDATGRITLTIPAPPPFSPPWYFGHVLFASDDPGYSPYSLLYVARPPRQSMNWGATPIMSRTQREALAATVGVTLDPAKGTVVFLGESCTHRPAPGVVVSIDSGERVYYYGESGTLDPQATKTASAAPIGFIWNVEPGARRLESKLDGVGTRVGTSLVRVGADSLTELLASPTPEGN